MAENTRKKKGKKKKKHRVFWFVIKLQIVLMMVVLGCFGYYYLGGYAEQVQKLQQTAIKKVAETDDRIFIPSQTSTIYDADGGILAELKGDKTSDYVSYEDIPGSFITAEISIEDKKFYSHNGVNLKGILRAAKAMLQNGQATQGGSTITMQLAKLMYLEPSKTWQYKVEQMFLAVELEKRYSKNKIMEFYLNNIYFANNYYGIQAACHGYFNCELKDLSLSQCAFLCAIPNSPSYYDPVTNISHTLERRDLILQNMLDDGKITLMQYTQAVGETITLKRPKSTASEMHNYVDTYVYYCATRALMEKEGFEFRYYFDSEEEEKDYNEEYDQLYTDCQKKIYTGGYNIYTSIRMDLQDKLQESVDEGLSGFSEQNEEGVYSMQGSAVCIDNETGHVVAIVGGRSQDFSIYTLNRAYQSHRQPGSSIKPLIVYTPCFERGYTPDTAVEDKEIEDGPSNSNGTYIGWTDVREAVARSINTVAWQLYEELTPAVGLSYLKEMNFSQIVEADETPATALGGFTKGVSALEMASAYAAIENDGMYRVPTCIETIVDSNESLVYVSEEAGHRIYEKEASRMMTDVLTDVLESSVGTGRRLKLSGMPAAGKTGTTNSHKDGWFVGYTRYFTTSVWVGYDIPREVSDLSGASYPGTIWHTFMEEIHEGLPKLDFLPYAKLSDDFQQEQDGPDEEERQEDDREEEPQVQEPEREPEPDPESIRQDDGDSGNHESDDRPDDRDAANSGGDNSDNDDSSAGNDEAGQSGRDAVDDGAATAGDRTGVGDSTRNSREDNDRDNGNDSGSSRDHDDDNGEEPDQQDDDIDDGGPGLELEVVD